MHEPASRPAGDAPAHPGTAAPHGRSAAGERLLTPLRVLWTTIEDFLGGDALITAGHLAFTGFFALFPFILFLVTLAGFIGETEAAAEGIALGLDLLPEEVGQAILPALDQIRGGASTGLLTVGILGALWAASSGLEGIRHALDVAYDSRDSRRHFLVLRLQSLLLIVVTALGLLLVVLLTIAAPFIKEAIEWLAQRDLGFAAGYDVVRLGLGLLILLALAVMLHLVLPATRLRLRHVLPGAALSVLLWAVVAQAYSAYLRHLGGYNLTYGGLGGIVLTLFFFYISAAVFIFGAQLNGTLLRRRRAAGADGRRP